MKIIVADDHDVVRSGIRAMVAGTEIEIIGEAARNISDEFRENHSKLPWGKMTGIRNKIIHEYFNINYAIVWDTVKDDLPLLKRSIKKIL